MTRYFSQQDKMRIGSSRYHIDGILGSKLGYTNTARYSYACLAEQNGVRLICVTMQSELSTDKYSDVRPCWTMPLPPLPVTRSCPAAA